MRFNRKKFDEAIINGLLFVGVCLVGLFFVALALLFINAIL